MLLGDLCRILYRALIIRRVAAHPLCAAVDKNVGGGTELCKTLIRHTTVCRAYHNGVLCQCEWSAGAGKA